MILFPHAVELDYSAHGNLAHASSSIYTAESYFQDGSSLRQQKSVASSTKSNSTNPFVPWRSEGFISSRMSDSRQSSDSDAYSSKSNVPEMKKRFDLIRRPAKAIAKYKRRTSVKDWFSFRSNSRQYHHLHKQDGVVSALQEDLEVLSMHSYSSNVRLLPPCEEMERADLPNLVLGTFAAASMPIGQRVTLPQFFIATSSSDGVIGGVVAKSAGNTPDCAGASTNVLVNRAPEPVVVAHASDQPTIRTHTIKDISSLDVVVSMIDSNDSSSIDAYSRSDFESSTTTSPTKTVSDSSYSSPFTANTSQPILHGSFASVKEDANDSVLVSSNTVMEDCVNDASSFGGDDVNATFYESKPVARKLPGTEIMLGNKPPSLVCDNDGSATRVFNLVSNSRSESGNFLFPSDEEDDDVVVDRKGVGVKVVTSTAGQEQPPNLITPIEPSTFFAE